MKVAYLFIALVSLGAGNLVHAGTEGHGGNVVVCSGKETVVLDYYHATLQKFGDAPVDIVDIRGMSREDVIKLFLDRVGNRIFRKELEDALSAIKPITEWIEADLHPVNDSNEPYTLPPGCALKTAAVRQAESTMFVDPVVARELSPAQQGVLVIHEAIYYIASQHGLHTSDRVRTLVRALLQNNVNDTEVARAIQEIGGNIFSDGIAYLKVGDRFWFEKKPSDILEVIHLDLSSRQVRLRDYRYNRTFWIECDESQRECRIISMEHSGGDLFTYKNRVVFYKDKDDKVLTIWFELWLPSGYQSWVFKQLKS